MQKNKNYYIPEIDGLRGLAIFIIILSHFNNSFVKSGGVNIFFIISGFLITQILTKNNFKIHIVDFYISRIKSLYPQILIVTFSTYIFFILFGDFEQFKIISRSFITSILGVSNFYLISIDNIYSLQEFINPYLPLWAFSVIMQFYLILPLLLKFILYILDKYSVEYKKLFIIFVVLTILLYLSYYLNRSNMIGDFYSPLSRLWQFTLGSCLFYFLHFYQFKKPLRVSVPFSYIALAILIAWQLFSDEINNFYIETIAISFAAIFLIYGSGNNSYVSRFLKSKISVHLGKISLPLYLWHMPVIYFLSIYFDGSIIIYLTIIITYLLSEISIRINSSNFIKTLFIKRNALKLIIIVTIILSAILASTKNKIFLKNLQNINYLFYVNSLFKEAYKGTYPLKHTKRDKFGNPCQANVDPFNNCHFNKEGKKNKIFLIGGSQMSALSYTLSKIFIEKDYQYIHITGSGCFYLPDFNLHKKHSHTIDPMCSAEFQNKVRKEILSSPGSIVILGGRYPLYLTSLYFNNQEGGVEGRKGKWNKYFKHKESKISIAQGIKNSIQELLDTNHKVILVYPIPEVGKRVPKTLRKSYHRRGYKLTTSYSVFLERTKDSFEILDSVNGNNLYRVYPHKLFCDNQIKGRCVTHDEKDMFYRDSNHPSSKGVEMINELIMKEFKKIELEV